MDCGICLEDYNSDSKVPMILPCGHTYCYPCIESIIKKKIKCPNCRALVPRNISAASLTVNYAVISMLNETVNPDMTSVKKISDMSFKELFKKHPHILYKQSKENLKTHITTFWHLYLVALLFFVSMIVFFKYFGAYMMNGLITFVIFVLIVSNGKFKRVSHSEGVYQGEMVNRKREGSGRFTFEDGDVVSGTWKKNQLDGDAKYKFSNGASLTGRWKEGRLTKIIYFKDLKQLPAYFNQQSRITGTYMPQMEKNLKKIQ